LDVIPYDGRDPHAEAILAAFGRFAGFLCLDYAGGENESAAMRRWIEGWRRTLAGVAPLTSLHGLTRD
ncbi:MAG: hypothetical protein JO101_10985, partial [Candidatus Eremiobacteraeota bacterium]|nr:hypothetical protein [Candidatus Eremiobacteraeota bacterium]